MVPAYSVKVPRVSTYSGYRHANRPFTYGAFTLSGRPSQAVLLSLLDQFRGPNPGVHALRFGLFPFRSPLLPESHVVFSSSGYLDVSVHRVPLLTLCIGVRILEVCSSGFPHSEISGSKDICSSPKLFAAYHVFHRLLVPRHPPCALSSLTSSISAAGTASIRRCIALHPWSLCLLDSFGYVSFDTPRMSCILNI